MDDPSRRRHSLLPEQRAARAYTYHCDPNDRKYQESRAGFKLLPITTHRELSLRALTAVPFPVNYGHLKSSQRASAARQAPPRPATPRHALPHA